MNDYRRKVMIIDGESEAARAFDGMLSSHWDVTAVGSVEEAADKAEREDFDVIVTGYVLPQISGQEGVLDLRSAANRVAAEKVALLGKVRDALGSFTADLQSMRPGSEEILRQSEAREEEVVGIFNNQLRRLQEEKVQTDQKLQDLEEKLKATVKEKALAEEKAKQALSQKAEMENEVASLSRAKAETEEALSKLRNEVATLGEELQIAAGITEKAVSEKSATVQKLDAAVREKSELQEKLTCLQENWERYIAANQ